MQYIAKFLSPRLKINKKCILVSVVHRFPHKTAFSVLETELRYRSTVGIRQSDRYMEW